MNRHETNKVRARNKIDLSPHKIFHKENYYLKIINSKKIDLAILRNEVEELIESVASRRVKNKDIDDKDTKDESQAETSLFPNFMSIGFDKLGSGRKSKRTKSNSSAKRNVPKEMSPETKVKIINQVILISSLLTFSKSYDVIDIMKHYSRINQHPDFSNLKKVYKKKHTKQK